MMTGDGVRSVSAGLKRALAEFEEGIAALSLPHLAQAYERRLIDAESAPIDGLASTNFKLALVYAALAIADAKDGNKEAGMHGLASLWYRDIAQRLLVDAMQGVHDIDEAMKSRRNKLVS